MKPQIATIVLLVGLGFSLAALVPRLAGVNLPGNQQGYEPKQPITFSHRLHAGDLQISCHYCHSSAEKSKHAGFPAAQLCMNCHKVVTASIAELRAEEEGALNEKRSRRMVFSAELKKLYAAMGLNDNLERDMKQNAPGLAWVRVHNLPAFACFDHRAHVHAGVACQTCHGPVETMERVRQVHSLSMGWCVNCHREANQTGVGGKKVHASLDCAACHY